MFPPILPYHHLPLHQETVYVKTTYTATYCGLFHFIIRIPLKTAHQQHNIKRCNQQSDDQQDRKVDLAIGKFPHDFPGGRQVNLQENRDGQLYGQKHLAVDQTHKRIGDKEDDDQRCQKDTNDPQLAVAVMNIVGLLEHPRNNGATRHSSGDR